MGARRIDHVGIVVDDLAAAIDFFAALGLEPVGEATLEGRWVDRVVGLDGVRSQIAMLQTPDGTGRVELTCFHAPEPGGDAAAGAPAPVPPANAVGIRHLAVEVDDIAVVLESLRGHGATLVGEVVDYGDRYRLAYVRGPAGIIVEVAQPRG